MSKYLYYLRSIPALLKGFEKPWLIAGIFLGWPRILPTEVVLKRPGWRFTVRSAMDVWIIKETCLDQDYTAGIVFEADWNVIDIGAGLGDFAILAAESCPDGFVHAYEPYGESFKLLEKNLILNQIDNVTCFEQAAGLSGSKLQPSGMSSEAVSTSFVEGAGDETIIPVTLGQIIDRLPDKHCDLLKIDCEGCEFDLLLGADDFQFSKIARILIEAHDGYFGCETQELIRFLRQEGYSVKQKRNPVHSYLSILSCER